MNRAKFLRSDDTNSPMQGVAAPYHYKGKMLITKDIPDKIDHTAFLVMCALSDCSSDNPFQDLGIHPDIIFSVMGQTAEGVRTDIEEVFEEFEDRLDLEDLQMSTDNEEGHLTADMTIYYRPFGQTIGLPSILPIGKGGPL